MNISYRWLRELAPEIQDEPEALAARLGMLGAPVEELARPGAGLGEVVVARVLRSRPHPNADRLTLCDVDAGGGEPVQVVCGAPNVEEGALYPFAPAGSSLPGGVELRRAKIRGEYSNGMLCSERELGLGRDGSGIMRLADAHTVGSPLVEALGLDDARLTLEVTPNRSDLLSHVGVARELAPEGHHGVHLQPFPDDGEGVRGDAPAPSIRRERTEGRASGVRLCIEDAAACPRYMAAVIEDVTVAPSPPWLASRLRSIGQRPINNVVDATNYVLHELGQPLHAFDLERLDGPEIRVRRARPGERITTLDDAERRLTADMLVIADAAAPVAVAGVMGGSTSEVTAVTTRVLLECAYFDPRSIRSTARALGLSTDASYRFERGVDMEGMERALLRAVELIAAVAGGRTEAALDVFPAPQEAPVVPLRPSRVEAVLGTPIPAEQIRDILQTLGFELRSRDDDILAFAVPGFRRHDVTREIDLIEEVARRYGYDRLDASPRPFRATTIADSPALRLEDRVREFMVGAGLLEARSVPMVAQSAGEVPLLRPLSSEESVLRSTVAHGLLRALELNFARGVRDVRLFEIGTTFHAGGPGGRPAEDRRVAVVLSGRREPPHWSGSADDHDLWDARGLLEQLGRVLGPGRAHVGPLGDEETGDLARRDLFRPGTVLALRTPAGVVGIGGEVAGKALDAPTWAAPAFALEIRLTEDMARRSRPALAPLATQPSSDRDLALLVPDSLPAAEVEATVREAAGGLLEAVEVFDVYRGRGVPEGVRSIAYRLVFRHAERTLKDEEVDRAIERVLNRLREVHGVERRG